MDKTAEEQIQEKMEDRFNDFERMSDFMALDSEDRNKFIDEMGYDPKDYETGDAQSDLLQDIINEYPLGVSKYELIRIELSTGGPGDRIDLIINDGDLMSGTYYFAEWFDVASRALSQKELDIIENIYGYLWDI